MINYGSLGLKDVKIVSLNQVEGKLEVFLEKETSQSTCHNCHTPSTSIKDHDYCQIIDKPIESVPLKLILKKRRFFCNNPACPIKSFTEEISGLLKKFSYTQNFKDFLAELYNDMDYPTIKKHLSRKYKLDLPLSTIHYLLKDLPIKKSDLPPFSPKAICKYTGIDEFSYARGHCYAVALINIDKGKIVDVVAGGKTTAAAMAVLNSCDAPSVEAACIDMWKPFKIACYKKLPNADVVVDKFHVIKQLNECLEDVRKRVSLELEAPQSTHIYQNRFLLLKGKERLSEIQRTKLASLLSINEELTKAYKFKELLRDLYQIKKKLAQILRNFFRNLL